MLIRNDITPQIARIASERKINKNLPLRLSYTGYVLRPKGNDLKSADPFTLFYQGQLKELENEITQRMISEDDARISRGTIRCDQSSRRQKTIAAKHRETRKHYQGRPRGARGFA